jgi:hypothetical protein
MSSAGTYIPDNRPETIAASLTSDYTRQFERKATAQRTLLRSSCVCSPDTLVMGPSLEPLVPLLQICLKIKRELRLARAVHSVTWPRRSANQFGRRRPTHSLLLAHTTGIEDANSLGATDHYEYCNRHRVCGFNRF